MNSAGQYQQADFSEEVLASWKTYYGNGEVRKRIAEFLGGSSINDATSQFITADDAIASWRRPRRASELWDCMECGLDIGRALWDRESLVVHLDVEHVNFDRPAQSYQDAERIFDLQKPVERAIRTLLDGWGIRPLRVLSGRGYHFMWQVGKHTPVFHDLVRLGQGKRTHSVTANGPHSLVGEMVSAEMSAAFAGLGLVMEFVAHRIKGLAAPRCAIPVELTAVEVGARFCDREMISIDISEYGDPLQTRVVRAPFSLYHKPAQQRWLIGEETLRTLPHFVFVPLEGIEAAEGLKIRRDLVRAAKFAGDVSTTIPEQAGGTQKLLAEYLASTLAAFHGFYYLQEQHPPEMWPETYDRMPMDILPKCARVMLEHPNDVLLHPASMRLVTRVLLALGWHPRHIAGLICSKFARDYGWGEQWRECDPAMRADFYTRVFAGLFMVGHDHLVDFNCQSSQEGRICPHTDCAFNLDPFRQSALARRYYDQLAHRPFNRLFLPTKDS